MKNNKSTIHIVADSIPQAFYRAITEVWNHGRRIRTEYDKKERVTENYINPPSRDASVMIEISSPFKEPRFSPISFCEIGKYIAEIMGVKDHLVVPIEELLEMIDSNRLDNNHWPYTYHQRLWSYPIPGGRTLNQVDAMLDRLSKSPYTRRAVASTRLPYIDDLLKEDQPCLGEVQLRCFEQDGILSLDMTTIWRSRDLYRAWCDNVIAITNWHQRFAYLLSEKMEREVIVGNYIEFNRSLHIYGECFSALEGNNELGFKSFFDNFPDEKSFIKRSMRSKDAKELLIIPQLKQLKTEKTWKFPEQSFQIIDRLIEEYESGKYIP